MVAAFPEEFDGARTFDEVVAALRALAGGLAPHDTVVSISLGTKDGIAMCSVTGSLSEITDHTGKDPSQSWAPGGWEVTFAVQPPPTMDPRQSQSRQRLRAFFALYPDRFSAAYLSTVDGVDHFILAIDMTDWHVHVTNAEKSGRAPTAALRQERHQRQARHRREPGWLECRRNRASPRS